MYTKGLQKILGSLTFAEVFENNTKMYIGLEGLQNLRFFNTKTFEIIQTN